MHKSMSHPTSAVVTERTVKCTHLSVEKINFYFAQQIVQKVTAPKFWMVHWVLTALCAMHAALLWPVKFLFFCLPLLIFKQLPAAYTTVACLYTTMCRQCVHRTTVCISTYTMTLATGRCSMQLLDNVGARKGNCGLLIAAPLQYNFNHAKCIFIALSCRI
jgi:hypothetical protein